MSTEPNLPPKKLGRPFKNPVDDVVTQRTRNSRLLSSCQGPHDFVSQHDPWYSHACSKCGGMVTKQQYHWYQIGIHHGLHAINYPAPTTK